MHKRSLISEIGYWKRYTELHIDPEADFLYRAELNGSSFVIDKTSPHLSSRRRGGAIRTARGAGMSWRTMRGASRRSQTFSTGNH